MRHVWRMWPHKHVHWLWTEHVDGLRPRVAEGAAAGVRLCQAHEPGTPAAAASRSYAGADFEAAAVLRALLRLAGVHA